ncbi:MAG: glutathionylspermidine synthase family protein [Phycisphaerales bacterium]
MTSTCTMRLSPRFEDSVERHLRDRFMFEAGKLDPQSFDHPTVLPRTLHISTGTWQHLAHIAERAWTELSSAEKVLLDHEDVWPKLGIPRRVQNLIRAERNAAHNAIAQVRFCRFDFHPTPNGWQASEINYDVPGGFLEAGPLTQIVAPHFNNVSCPPNPAQILAQQLAQAIQNQNFPPTAAMMHATSYSDDQQVMRCIAAELARFGIATLDTAPDHLALDQNRVINTLTNQPLGCIVRFFPAEWLTHIRNQRSLRALTTGPFIRCNPLSALLLQSKRTPLILQSLGVPLPTWSTLLPRVHAIGSRRWHPQLIAPKAVLKPNWGRVGESVCIPNATPNKTTKRATLAARLFPSHWILQDRFDSIPLSSDEGDYHVCLGVYVINDKAAGIYARAARVAVIDHRAQDVAVLIDPSLDARQPSSHINFDSQIARSTHETQAPHTQHTKEVLVGSA